MKSKTSLDFEKIGSNLYIFLKNNKIDNSFFDPNSSKLTNIQLSIIFRDQQGENQIKNSINQERQYAQAEMLAEKLRNELENGSTFQQLKDNYENIDLISGDTKLLIRSFQSLGKSNYLVGALSKAKKGDLIGPLKTPRGYGIVNIVDISPIDSTDFEMKRDVIYDNLSNQKRNSNFQSWYDDFLDNAKIIDNRKYYF